MVKTILLIVLVYIILGVIVSVYLIFFRLKEKDSNLEGTSLWMKLILIPGSSVLWPILLKRATQK